MDFDKESSNTILILTYLVSLAEYVGGVIFIDHYEFGFFRKGIFTPMYFFLAKKPNF